MRRAGSATRASIISTTAAKRPAVRSVKLSQRKPYGALRPLRSTQALVSQAGGPVEVYQGQASSVVLWGEISSTPVSCVLQESDFTNASAFHTAAASALGQLPQHLAHLLPKEESDLVAEAEANDELLRDNADAELTSYRLRYEAQLSTYEAGVEAATAQAEWDLDKAHDWEQAAKDSPAQAAYYQGLANSYRASSRKSRQTARELQKLIAATEADWESDKEEVKYELTAAREAFASQQREDYLEEVKAAQATLEAWQEANDPQFICQDAYDALKPKAPFGNAPFVIYDGSAGYQFK